MSDSQTALEEATGHLEKAAAHHTEARSTHADVRVGIERVRDLVTRALTAHTADDHAKVKRHLNDIAAEAKLSGERHTDTASSHSATRRAMEAAQRSLKRAVEEAAPAEHDPVANPTAAMGAQTSNGQSPRDYSPEAIRERDQRRAVEFCHARRLEQLKGGRQ